MDKKEPDKATQPLFKCLSQDLRLYYRSKAFVLTWIDFKYDGV